LHISKYTTFKPITHVVLSYSNLAMYLTLHLFKIIYFFLDKSYNSAENENRRRNIFSKNAGKVKKHNAAGTSYTLELNEFADLEFEEFNTIYNGFRMPVNITVTLI